MTRLNIPIGISDFSEIRQNNYYYIDKSALVSELLETAATKVTLITRPRRFGKTLAMSMLSSFFDITRNSRALFDGLEVSGDAEVCSSWMNQYPTVFLTFKNVDGLTFSSAYGQLKYEIADLYKRYDFLLSSERISEEEKRLFDQIRQRTAGEIEVRRSIQLILQLLSEYYNKPAILLLDEYDVPLAKASSQGYYDEMLEVIRSMMITALKDNPSLRFAIITGCLKIAKESIFTGTNNFVSDTVSSTRLNEYFGFTQKEVEKILGDTDEEARFTLGSKHLMFQIGEATLVCRLLEGEFLDWRRVLPTENPIKLTANVEQLNASIERVSLIVSERLKSPVRCVFSDNSADFKTVTTIGAAHDVCSVAGDGKNLEIGFNCRYLLDALKAVPAQEVTLELSNGLSPIVLTPTDGSDQFAYMVLPVRLKESM